MIFDPDTLDRRTLHGLLTGLILPRPIAWVSTISADGQRNLAPFSFFNAFTVVPPVIVIGPGSRKGVNKDTLRNCRETGEFVVSVVTEDLADLCNATSAEFGPDISEWDVLSIEGTASLEVQPQRVAASPAAFECRVIQIVDLGETDKQASALVVGRVLHIHVDDAALDGNRPRSEVLRLVGRMGGREWCRTSETFEMIRPTSTDPDEVRKSLESDS